MPRRTIGGRYELEQPLGGGAMSSVWLAQDRELERRVAVKLLAANADRTRFEREAHAVAALAHPNICQLYDYGESDEGPYMVLEYLPGGTLEDRLARGKALPDDEALRIAREISAGLAHAHERGLVHRDLKPANILFDAEQRAKIADFGIARIEDGNELTVAGTVLGTAAYLSPEQAAGLPASPASDVYSFGVIVFRMLTGRPPFVADSAMELVRLHQQAEPPSIGELRPDAPPLLTTLVAAALAKDPADRPRDGAALLRALSGGTDRTLLLPPAAVDRAAGLTYEGATQVIPRARPRRRRAMPAIAALAAVALALVGVAAAVLLTGSSDGNGVASTPSGSLSLPTVGREKTALSTSSLPSTTTTTATATTSSTSSTSSTRSTTTRPAPTTTALPVTTSPTPPPPTTAPATTAPATTTAPPPTTSTAPVTTTTAAAATTTTTATP